MDVPATRAALKAPITAASNAWLPLIAIGPSRRSSASHHASGVAWPTASGGRRGGTREGEDTAGAGRHVDIGVIRAARVEVQLADARHRAP